MKRLATATVIAAACVGAAGLSPLGCAELPDVAQPSCGNLITEMESGEDCDGFPVGPDGVATTDGSGFKCNTTCRVECDLDNKCPAGWGCGFDYICRRPTGTFAIEGTPINESVERMMTGDVDGDGAAEVIVDTGAELKVHYFDELGQVALTRSITGVRTTPAVGDFDGVDANDDIVYRLDTAVTVLRGADDRTLSPQPFPVPLPEGSEVAPGQRIIPIGTTGIDGRSFKLRELLHLDQDKITTFTGNLAMGTTTPIDIASVGLANLRSPDEHVPVGDFDASRPCTQFVIPNKATNALEVYAPCVPGSAVGDSVWSTPSTSMISSVTIPAGGKIDGPTFAYDVDHDGNLDLVVMVSGPNAADPSHPHYFIAVAYGDGAGQFRSDPSPSAPKDNRVGAHLCLDGIPVDVGGPSDRSNCAAREPLAVVDVDGDGVLDIANACGLMFSVKNKINPAKCDGDRFVLAYDAKANLSGAEWTRALVTDLNGDGAADVVGASCSNPSITYLQGPLAFGNGKVLVPTFNAYTIPTIAGIDDLAAGDFDGDQVGDVIFVERDGASPACGDGITDGGQRSLGAVFGSRSGGPSTPVTLAQIGPTAQLAPDYLTSTTSAFDLVTDLAVVSHGTTDADKDATLFHVFQGSTDRQIIAPYYLVAPDDGHPNIPWLPVMGRFTGPDDPTSLAVFASDADKTRLWLLAQSGSELLANVPLTVTSNVVGSAADFLVPNATKSVWVAPVNLDETAGDSVITLVRDSDHHVGVLALFAVQDGAFVLPGTQTDGYLNLGTDYLGPIVVADVDAQSGKDVVLVSPTEGALVLWNSQSGALHIDDATPVGVPELGGACGEDVPEFVAVTTIQGAAGEARQLVLLSTKKGYLVTFDPKTHAAATVECIEGLEGPFDRARVVSGDVDGDGVEDLVIAANGKVKVYHGTPVNQ